MPIDQPPTIIEQQVTREPTGQQQWSALMDSIIREQAVAREWLRDMLCVALAKIVADSISVGRMPNP